MVVGFFVEICGCFFCCWVLFFFWLGRIMLRLKSIQELKAELSHCPILVVYIQLHLLLPCSHQLIVCTLLPAHTQTNAGRLFPCTPKCSGSPVACPQPVCPSLSSANPCGSSDVSAAGGCWLHEVLSESRHVLPALIHWDNLPGTRRVTNAMVCRARAWEIASAQTFVALPPSCDSCRWLYQEPKVN